MSSDNSAQSAHDERLQAALSAANYRICLTNQKNNAKTKLQKDLSFSINGGTFQVSPELISFVSTLIGRGRSQSILLDINSNPIEILDLSQFLDTIIEIYHECTNDFLHEMKKIQKSRTTAAVVGEK